MQSSSSITTTTDSQVTEDIKPKVLSNEPSNLPASRPQTCPSSNLVPSTEPPISKVTSPPRPQPDQQWYSTENVPPPFSNSTEPVPTEEQKQKITNLMKLLKQ